MRRLALAAAVVGMFLSACDRDDPGPQDLVTYTLEVDADWWMFASAPDGSVLDSKKLTYNEPVALTASHPPDSFSITLVRVQRASFLLLDITTYTGVKPGQVFTPKIFDPEEIERPEQEGKVTVQITNYPVDETLPLIVSDDYQSTSSDIGGASTRTFVMNTWKSKTPRFLVTAYNGDRLHPVYTYVDGSGADETIVVDFNTFAPFEKTFEIKGFNTQHQVALGFTMFSTLSENFTGTKFADVGWEYAGSSPVAKVGYLDDLANYYYDLEMLEFVDEIGLARVHKITHNGPLTQPVQVFNDHLTVNKESMKDFDFEFTGDYQVRSQLYSNSGSSSASVSWTIYSPPGTPSAIVQIPDEMLLKYPDMVSSNMEYQGSRFYKYDDGYTYEDLIRDVFTTSYGPEHPGYMQGFPNR